MFLKIFLHSSSIANAYTIGNSNDYKFGNISTEPYASLITNDQIKQRINEILCEYSRLIYMLIDEYYPEQLTVQNMSDLLKLADKDQRTIFYEFLCKRERLRVVNKNEKKAQSEKYWAEQREKYGTMGIRSGMFDQNGNILYGLWHNTLVSKIHTTQIKRLRANRLRVGAMFGQKVIFDLGYDQHMIAKEFNKLGREIQLANNYNKYKTVEPFDIHYTDCNMSGPSIEYIKRHLPDCKQTNFYSLFHTKSYLELFPKNNLVYLTTHKLGPKNAVIDWYDPNDIYVIGGHISMRRQGSVGYAKAMNAGVRCYGLPIDKYVLRTGKRLNLTFPLILAILNDVKTDKNWGDAIRKNIPEFNIKTAEEIAIEDEFRTQKRKLRIEKFEKFNKLSNYLIKDKNSF